MPSGKINIDTVKKVLFCCSNNAIALQAMKNIIAMNNNLMGGGENNFLFVQR